MISRNILGRVNSASKPRRVFPATRPLSIAMLPKPVFLLVETNPETLNYVQLLEFSSFVDSDKSDDHEQVQETPMKLSPHFGQTRRMHTNLHGGQTMPSGFGNDATYSNNPVHIMNIGASGAGPIEVDSASDDPFGSDDIQELLKAYPSTNSPVKMEQNSSPVKQHTPSLESCTASSKLSHLPQAPHVIQTYMTHPASLNHNSGIKVNPEYDNTSKYTQQNTVMSPGDSASSPDAYFSCKSEPEAEHGLAAARPTLLNRNAAKKSASVTLQPQSSNLGTSPDTSLSSIRPSARLFSPEKFSPGTFKRPRFSSPMKQQSYESQMQYRTFSTNASKLASLSNEHPERPQSRDQTIQLATQKPNISTGADFVIDETGSPDLVKVAKPFCLSREQKYVLDLAVAGKSLFFTGSAGTGKSILLKSIIKELRARKPAGSVAVTASTGLAACNIGGTTLHSFAGIGLGKGDTNSLLRTVRRNRALVRKWKESEVLIIDEISMIDGKLFDALDTIARSIRRQYSLPFGGMQIIVCGDYYQLPPVNQKEILADGTHRQTKAVFAFESKAWEALDHSIVLKEVFRQKGDQEFIDMLNDMRHGKVTADAADEFRRLSRPLYCPADILPTELYATRSEVMNANTLKLKGIKSKEKLYTARDGGSLPPHVRTQWLLNFLAPSELVLKVDAQVMCLKNIDTTLVNGSLGKVIRFVDRNTYMCETVNEKYPYLSFEEFQEALKEEYISKGYGKKDDYIFNFLAEAEAQKDGAEQAMNAENTENDKEVEDSKTRNGNGVIKTEGTDEVQPDNQGDVKTETNSDMRAEVKPEPVQTMGEANNEAFEESQGDPFEAGSSFVKIDQEAITQQNTERKLQFIKDLEATSQSEQYPLVRFICPDGVTTRDHLVEPERWDIEDDKTQKVLVYRIQFPLMLAWALSIHKSQGQTLPKVKVDLSNIFENGQAYVALSRATSRLGLQVLNFREHRVRAHPMVETFYRTLLTSEDLAGGEFQVETNAMDDHGAEA